MLQELQIDLIKLTTGARLLRLTDARSGLCLEKTLDPQQPVARQKERLGRAFREPLARELVETTS